MKLYIEVESDVNSNIDIHGSIIHAHTVLPVESQSDVNSSLQLCCMIASCMFLSLQLRCEDSAPSCSGDDFLVSRGKVRF